MTLIQAYKAGGFLHTKAVSLRFNIRISLDEQTPEHCGALRWPYDLARSPCLESRERHQKDFPTGTLDDSVRPCTGAYVYILQRT